MVMTFSVDKIHYWEKVVDYFYDHVWRLQVLSIEEWLLQEHNASVDRSGFIKFESEVDRTMFLLKWA